MALDTTPLTAVDDFTADLYPPKVGTTVRAADVLAGEQVLLNRTKHIGNFYGCLGSVQRAVDDPTDAQLFTPWGSTSYADDATYPETFAGLKSGDLVVITVTGVARLNRTAAGQSGDIRMKVIDQFGGGSPATFNPDGARVHLGNDTSADPTAGERQPFTLTTTRTVSADGDMKVILQGKTSATGAGVNIGIYGVLVIHIVAFRQQKNAL